MPWETKLTYVPCCTDMKKFLHGISYFSLSIVSGRLVMENHIEEHTFAYCPFCGVHIADGRSKKMEEVSAHVMGYAS